MTGKKISDVLFAAIKSTVAAVVAIGIAELIGLESTVSAGTVAILTIQPTKKETVKTAISRIYAFVVSMVLSYICFNLIGFTMPAFMLFLVIFIFICYFMGWQGSIATCALIIAHFLRFGVTNAHTMGNETLIFLIGVSTGVVANLHLRKDTNYIEILKTDTDAQFKNILMLMSKRVLDNNVEEYNEEVFESLRKSIRHAKTVAEANYNNQLRSKDTYDIDYIHMRDAQWLVLYDIFTSLQNIHTTPFTAHVISDFLVEMSQVDDNHGAVDELMGKFRELDISMKSKPLPVTRPEFEDRARLFMLLRDIEEFINLKLEFTEKYPQK